MAELAIDILDLNWRLLRGFEKKLTPRGRSRMSRPLRRVRGSRCHETRHHGPGHGLLATELASRVETELELSESDDMTDAPVRGRVEAIGFNIETYVARKARAVRRTARTYERSTRQADLNDLGTEETESAIMFMTETQLRRARERVPNLHGRRRFLKDFIEFLEHRKRLDKLSQGLLVKCYLELAELEVLLQH